MTLIKIVDLATTNLNIFKASPEELVANALDEAGLLKYSTIINNILAKDLCKSYNAKKDNFQESTKLGYLLVKNNIITHEQLNEAINYQRKNPNAKLGAVLINFNFCNIDDIEKFLMTQLQLREDINELDNFMQKIAIIKARLRENLLGNQY
jgi:hypothetical protein